MIKTKYYTKAKQLFRGFFILFFTLIISCDLKNPASFKMPTWFFDLMFPLVQQKYSLEGMVDNKQIFSTPDSLGMQLMFEGVLPDTSIGSDILEIDLDQSIKFSTPKSSGPSFSYSLDTSIVVRIPIAPDGKLKNSGGFPFDVPPKIDQTMKVSDWNAIAGSISPSQTIEIPIPSIPSNQLPDIIESIDSYIIKRDSGDNNSSFASKFINNGIPSSIVNADAKLKTEITSTEKTLANHLDSGSISNGNNYTKSTSLSEENLGSKILIPLGFALSNITEGNLITIKKDDSVQVNIEIALKITGIDSAVASINDTEIPLEIPEISFPAVAEIFSGKLKTPSAAGVNEIKINKIESGYPANVDFLMNFKNFKPSAGKDSVKVDTVLTKGTSFSKIYNMDGYTFYNPAGQDSTISKLLIETSAKLKSQKTSIPLDGSDFGGMEVDVGMKGLHFESLEANVVQEFPPTEFSIAGMPLGFSGMKFVDTKLEIEMNNGIRLPVVLDFDMVGVNQKGDTSKVNALSTLASPNQKGDTTKTLVRLSGLGTTTLKYKAPASIQYYDSTTIGAKNNETTIVELMSSNPANFTVRSRARIDGRGTLEDGMHIGGKYRMLAPFEVIMEPMTFISVTNTPVQEMNYENRNRIRSTLQSASMLFSVENKIPISGDLSMLMSNLEVFPLDTTASALRDFRDSLVVKKNWVNSDSVYIVSKCDSLNPETSSIFIFDVMTDFSECINGVSYLVKSSMGSDTIFSYVDTLLKIPLPEPKSFHAVTNSGVHAGQVREAGSITYSSPLSKERVRLMTDPGQPYMAPRFFLEGSKGKRVYLTTGDYLDINSSVTFSLSSTGMGSPAPNEIVVKFPNGGESLEKDTQYSIKWKTYGTISKVDLSYFFGSSADLEKDEGWVEISTEIANVDSFSWIPSSTTGLSSAKDSLRIRVKSSDGKIRDMSGWYFSVTEKSSKIISEQNSNHFVIKKMIDE